MLRVTDGDTVSIGSADPAPGSTVLLADESHAEALSEPRLRKRFVPVLGSSGERRRRRRRPYADKTGSDKAGIDWSV